RGWRAAPLSNAGSALSAGLVDHRVLLGVLPASSGAAAITQGARALLAQEIRSARGGHYTFTAQISGGGASQQDFERTFAHLTCRLVLFRYTNINKDPAGATILASADFRPGFGDTPVAYEVNRFLGSTVPGANFAIGNGLGVAVTIEKTSPGTLTHSGSGPHRAFVRIHSVSLEFSPRPRDESVDF